MTPRCHRAGAGGWGAHRLLGGESELRVVRSYVLFHRIYESRVLGMHPTDPNLRRNRDAPTWSASPRREAVPVDDPISVTPRTRGRAIRPTQEHDSRPAAGNAAAAPPPARRSRGIHGPQAVAHRPVTAARCEVWPRPRRGYAALNRPTSSRPGRNVHGRLVTLLQAARAWAATVGMLPARHPDCGIHTNLRSLHIRGEACEPTSISTTT